MPNFSWTVVLICTTGAAYFPYLLSPAYQMAEISEELAKASNVEGSSIASVEKPKSEATEGGGGGGLGSFFVRAAGYLN